MEFVKKALYVVVGGVAGYLLSENKDTVVSLVRKVLPSGKSDASDIPPVG